MPYAGLLLTTAPPRSFADIVIQLPPTEREIDNGIMNLSKATILLGADAFASCEGHMNPDEKGMRYKFPWVNIDQRTRPIEFDQLVSLVKAFNEKRRVQWMFEPGVNPGLYMLRPTFQASSEEELRLFQDSAQELAEFIFKEAVKKYVPLKR